MNEQVSSAGDASTPKERLSSGGPNPIRISDFFDRDPRKWQQRAAIAAELMRELSTLDNPQMMYQVFGRRMRELYPTSRQISLSRRGLKPPHYRVTRYSEWDANVNPWKDTHRLPLLAGGLFAELIYADEPQIIDDIYLDANDPAAAYLHGQRSLMAIPHYDGGTGLNMVILTREELGAFPRERLPEMIWMSNLFGRVTHGLVLSEKLQDALAAMDNEMLHIANIQRSLLPSHMPKMSSLDLAVHYQTSQRAGGDYYDFFPLKEGRLGMLIADVSGHGTPAAVMMAITHTLAHAYEGLLEPPGELLAYLNRQLCQHYTAESGAFVTAFYAVYDPQASTLTYASAGHNPPRVVRCADQTRYVLNERQQLPLGILPEESYPHGLFTLVPGDQIILYTDGITEATNRRGEMFGPERLDRVLAACPVGAEAMLKAVLDALEAFTEGQAAADDRTLLVAKRLGD